MNAIRYLVDDFRGWHWTSYAWLLVATGTMIGISIALGDTWLGIVSALTNIVCVILVAKGKITNYIWGTIGVLTYGYLAYQWEYYGDTMLNLLYYLPMQLVGFMLWRNRITADVNEATDSARPRTLSVQLRLSVLSGSLALISLYTIVLLYLEGRMPWLDSTSTVLSVVAMVLMAFRYVEQWYLWIIVNIVSIIMWLDVASTNEGQGVAILLMWVVFLLNAVFGLVNWKRAERIVQQPN